MSSIATPDRIETSRRRHKKRVTVVGLVAAGLIVSSIGSYAAMRAIPAEFPLLYSERLPTGTTEGVALATPETALNFARVDIGAGPTVLAVTAYENDTITGVDITQAAGTHITEPIDAFTQLGYDAIADIVRDPARPLVTVHRSEVLTALDTHSHHVGTGTNYEEHQAEATIEEPFLFPKIGALTDSDEPLPAGRGGLLDYEVELGLVPLDDITAETGVPDHMGLILTNDWTDRELLLSQVDVDDLTSGAGFTNGKSQPGFFSTGDLFVIPADWKTYYQELELDLWVNGDLRQRADPGDMIWDASTVIEKVLASGGRTWDSDGQQTALTSEPGVIARGTVMQSGTPEGPVYRAPDTRQRILGFLEFVGTFGTNADSIVDSALGVYIREAHEAEVYLAAGDTIVTRADGLGQIFTTIVSGDRSDTE